MKPKKELLNSRRGFLKTTAQASAVVFVGSRVKAAAEPPFIIRDFELEEITIAELQAGMKTGKYTARSLVESYLSRIEAIDKNGPAVNSVIELNPDALAIADALDKEQRETGSRSQLHGIPMLIKDNIDTADRMRTSAGSLALDQSTPAKDAFVAQKLREAGAIILGKTNLSEWANFRSTHSTSGWSGRGGLTKNPYALDRNPCGSSSGSGVAAAANLCAAAIGTETDGSIVCPSNMNSLVGIKPTVGLVSRAGIIPISHTQDTAGPMCRTVTDAAIVLGALTGIDPRDKTTLQSRGKALTDYTKFLDANGLKGARLGIVRKSFGFNPAVDILMNEAIAAMKRAGAIIVDPANIPHVGEYDDSEFEVLLYEFKADLNAYLAGLGAKAPAKSLKELIDYNQKHRDREMPYFEQEIFMRSEAKGDLKSPAYLKALAKNLRLSRTEGIDAVMLKHKLDALIAPTGGPPWTTDLVNGDHFSGGLSSPPAVAGYPHITMPLGYIFGLPVGISFAGRAYTEPTLIKIAYAFEQISKVRKPPKFLPTADLR
ncbi:MAG: amidase [Acidobacteriota bacterium]